MENISVGLYSTQKSVWDTGNDVMEINGQKLYPAYDVYGKKIKEKKTDSTGNYSFENLPPDNYYVYFTGIQKYQITELHQGEDTDVDSDAEAVIKDDGTKAAYVKDIQFPDISKMTSYLYISKNNDIGLYYDGAVLRLRKNQKTLSSTAKEKIEKQVFTFVVQPDENNKAAAYYKDADGKMKALAKDGMEASVTITELNKEVPFDFSNIYFKTAGDYSFTIKEVIPKDTDQKNGMYTKGDITYPGKEYHVDISVTTEQCVDGASVVPKITTDGKITDSIHFENYYKLKRYTPALPKTGTFAGLATIIVGSICILVYIIKKRK